MAIKERRIGQPRAGSALAVAAAAVRTASSAGALRTGRATPTTLALVRPARKAPAREAVADARGDWPGAIILVSHDEDFVRELAPTKVLLMPDGDVDYFSEDWLDLVSMS